MSTPADASPECVIGVDRLWKVFGPPGVLKALGDPGADRDALDAAVKAGAVAAVRDLSFSVRRGEVFVVMGLSGSGKSTLIRSLLRLIEPTAGRIQMAGEEVTALTPKALTEFRRHKTGMVFQHYGLLPHKTVLQNAAFALKLKGVPKAERLERAAAALKRVGLAKWASHRPHALSGGMRQRVGIARALATDPEILLMDEPFSGLDPLIRREMQDELLHLQSELHKSILFVTHDLHEAVRLGDRMAVMRSGRFVQVDEPQAVLERPADAYVERFVQTEALAPKGASPKEATDDGTAAAARSDRPDEDTVLGAVSS